MVSEGACVAVSVIVAVAAAVILLMCVEKEASSISPDQDDKR